MFQYNIVRPLQISCFPSYACICFCQQLNFHYFVFSAGYSVNISKAHMYECHLTCLNRNKRLIYSKQSEMGYACAEKTNIKAEIIIQKAVHGLKIPDYYNQETLVQSTRSYHPFYITHFH